MRSSRFSSFRVKKTASPPTPAALTNASSPSLTNIGGSGFKGCVNLHTALFPNLKVVGRTVFENCARLTNLSFPLLTGHDYYSFSGISGLQTLSLDSVTSLMVLEFASCSNLTTLYIPEAVVLQSTPFQFCVSLTNVSFPKVTSIPSLTFYKCENTVAAKFPAEVTQIGSYAFSNNTRLAHVLIGGTNSGGVHALAFATTPSTKILYIDSSLVADAKNNVAGKPFANFMTQHGFADIKRLEDYPY